MYLEVEKRELKGKGISYRVKICESFKINGKSKKKTIRNVGTCKEEKEIEFLKRQGLKLIEIEMEKKNGGLLFDATASHDTCEISTPNVDYRKLKEEKRISEGVREVYGTLFDNSGFSSLLKGKQSEILKEVVVSRIEEPCSKRRTQEVLEKDCNFKTSLDSIYRTVSALSKKTNLLIKLASQDTKTLFPEKIDVIFFDVSTLYFESTIQDEIRDFGYSKDNKFKETQVVLALATTPKGLPVGYKIFPGNTAETTTLLACLNEWKNHIEIERVVFVADRGMFNYSNLEALSKSGYEFIVGATLRKMPSELKNFIINDKFFSQENCKIFSEKECVRSIPHEIAYKNKDTGINSIIKGNLVVCRNQTRAKKDASDREKLVTKINKTIGKSKSDAKKLITNKGYLKFTKLQGQIISSLNEKKIEEDRQWDGIFGIYTNTNLSEEEILSRYRGLWEIELAFRVSKTDLAMRPIFHRKKERIEGHIAICFMALYLIKKCQILLERSNLKLSPERICIELERVQSSIVYDKHRAIRFRLPSNMSTDAKAIYKALNIDRSLNIQKI